MKGKRLLQYSLITMLFVSMAMVDISSGQNATKLSVNPDEIEDVNPCCDPFDIRIEIEDVEDLHAYGFTLRYAPLARVLVPISVTEGPFLAQGGDTFFATKIDTFQGQVTVGCTLLPSEEQGVSGSGTLVAIKFLVAQAGESPLDLTDIHLLNSNLELITEYNVEHGYYKGPTVEIVNIDHENWGQVSEKQTFNATVKKRSEACEHEPEEPSLWTFVRFDMVRVEDGRIISLTTDTCEIAEGAPYTFDPVEWYPEVGDVGTYVCAATVLFRYYDTWFNYGRKMWGFMLTVTP